MRISDWSSDVCSSDLEDAGDDLDDQDQQGQGSEKVPEVEILGRVVLGQVRLPGRGYREAPVQPAQQACCLDGFFASHQWLLLYEAYFAKVGGKDRTSVV